MRLWTIQPLVLMRLSEKPDTMYVISVNPHILSPANHLKKPMIG